MKHIETLYQQYLKSRVVTTDSRKITPGCIFFAFKGESFDGNAFAPQALEKGASLCVISDERYANDPRCILVPDVLKTLQELALHHRKQQHIPFIGITGTNGKTTTKELVNAVLSKKYRTHATAGNYNNHLGVPLTLLAMPANTEIAIIEMGANHPGEIAFLCNIARPTCGLITNCGKAHLEGFGSFEGVVKTKTELYRFLASQQGSTLFVNNDNEILMKEASQLCSTAGTLRTATYGSAEEAGTKGSYIGSDPYMKFYFEDGDNVYTVQSQLLGGYNFDNAMAAVAVGQFFGVEMFDIKEAIQEYTPSNNRSQYKETASNALFLDCYNANPSSMKVAIDNFAALKREHKLVFLGGMKELGNDSAQEHDNLVKRLLAADFEKIVLVGPEFEIHAHSDARIEWYASSSDAKAYYAAHPICEATILLKGSNSNKMWLLEEVF